MDSGANSGDKLLPSSLSNGRWYAAAEVVVIVPLEDLGNAP